MSNALTLVSVKEELEGQVITEEICLDLIKMGNEIKGYGFFLAKEEVHKDSIGGWEHFCNMTGVSRSTADRQIRFYVAKISPRGPELPNTEKNFRELFGDTTDEKIESYEKVKKVTHKEEPSGIDIKVAQAINSRGIKDKELVKKTQEFFNGASRNVKEAFMKNSKGVGFKRIVEAKDIVDDDAMIKIIENKSPAKIAGAGTINQKYKDRILELEAKVNTQSALNDMTVLLAVTKDAITFLKKLERMNKRKFDDMVPEVKRAYEVLKIKILDKPVEFEIVRKQYREMAKKAHPDKGGSADLFAEVNEAYNTLKEMAGR